MATRAVLDEGPEALAEPADRPLPKARRHGIGLCLSGGGYRATLFHLGSLRRLNELGILARADFRTVSSVSGGSITAAWLATAFARHHGLTAAPIPDEAWEREIRGPLRAFTRKNIRTGAIAKRLLPWNWHRKSTGVEALAARYEKDLTDLRLVDMPARPNFVLCATDMAYGVNWVYERGRLGDYQAGYQRPPAAGFPLARAVAASACFPPVFNPLPAGVTPGELQGGKAPLGPERDECIRGLHLTDGGDYDNMGLEPVWKDHAFVLVSDAGGLFTSQGDRGLAWRIPRYQAIQERQARAVRKRWLISSFDLNDLDGTYWSVGSSRSAYERAGGYAADLARTVIAEIRTDLDAFSDAEAAVLENHGYWLADAAIHRYAPALLGAGAPPARDPHPEWMDEAKVRAALKDSGRRKTLGRWKADR
jgi:NTE family protein